MVRGVGRADARPGRGRRRAVGRPGPQGGGGAALLAVLAGLEGGRHRAVRADDGVRRPAARGHPGGHRLRRRGGRRAVRGPAVQVPVRRERVDPRRGRGRDRALGRAAAASCGPAGGPACATSTTRPTDGWNEMLGREVALVEADAATRKRLGQPIRPADWTRPIFGREVTAELARARPRAATRVDACRPPAAQGLPPPARRRARAGRAVDGRQGVHGRRDGEGRHARQGDALPRRRPAERLRRLRH